MGEASRAGGPYRVFGLVRGKAVVCVRRGDARLRGRNGSETRRSWLDGPGVVL